MNRIFGWSRAKKEKSSFTRTVLDGAVAFKKKMDAYGKSHNWADRIKHGLMKLVEGAGYGVAAGVLAGAAYNGGWTGLLTAGTGMTLTGKAFAALVENGAEHLVDYAISQADTREQAHDYADVAISLVETGATGLAAFGTFKAVRGFSTKAAALRTNYSKSKIDATFQQKRTNPAGFEASVSKGVSEAMGKNPLMKLEMERLADATNKAPYNPRAMESLLQSRYPDAVASHTLPGLSQPNVRLAGMHKERIIGHDPLTQEPITQRVTFDQRGFPVFDPYVKVETRISGNLGSMSREAHMIAATRQLKADIDTGRVNRSMFNEKEFAHIQAGREKIGNFTWHHHQDTGRMQLVPTNVHDWVGHIGGNKLWGKPK